MTTRTPDVESPTGPNAGPGTAATEARERIETARLVSRRRHGFRLVLIFLASVGLLVTAAVLRRDQVRRDTAVKDLRVVAAALDQWVHMHGGFPPDLDAVLDKQMAGLMQRYEYTDAGRLDLARRQGEAVIIIFDRDPLNMTLGQPGRAVVWTRRGDFQTKWMSEREFQRQRWIEEGVIRKIRENPRAPGAS